MPLQQTPVYTPQPSPQSATPAGPNPPAEVQMPAPTYAQPAPLNQPPAPSAPIAQTPYQPLPQQPQTAYAQPPAPVATTTQEKRSLIFGIIGIAVFIIGLLVGIAAVAGAVCGAVAIRYAMPTKYAPGLTSGIMALVLNIGLYAVALLVK